VANFYEVSRIIDSYSVGPDFLGKVTSNEIHEAEAKLGVKFPRSYKQFLQQYGCGNFGGEIYGVGVSETGVPSVVWFTLKMREEGFIPNWMVIVCNEGEYVLCLDTATFDENEECKVVSWILGLPFDKQPHELTFESFADFLSEYVHNAIEEGWWKK
jgi:cell wall assembly regulator SMI1